MPSVVAVVPHVGVKPSLDSGYPISHWRTQDEQEVEVAWAAEWGWQPLFLSTTSSYTASASEHPLDIRVTIPVLSVSVDGGGL